MEFVEDARGEAWDDFLELAVQLLFLAGWGVSTFAHSFPARTFL